MAGDLKNKFFSNKFLYLKEDTRIDISVLISILETGDFLSKRNTLSLVISILLY